MVRTSDLAFECSVVRAYHPYIFRESSVTTFMLFKIRSQSLSIDVVLVGRINLVPRVFSLSNMAAAGEKTLAHSELKRPLIGAFCCAFIRALSLVYSFQNKDGYPLRAS